MTLGSPVNSPGHVSPIMHQVSHGSQYLPSYLMGEAHAASVWFDCECAIALSCMFYVLDVVLKVLWLYVAKPPAKIMLIEVLNMILESGKRNW